MRNKRIKAASLFANVGVSEAYLKDAGVDVVLADEIETKRRDFYASIYKGSEAIAGDLTKADVKASIISKCVEKGVKLIIATPPCQGMSQASQGQRDPNDPRNRLICDAVEVIRGVDPDYVLFENVPELVRTKIDVMGEGKFITDYLDEALGDLYDVRTKVLNAADYGVPQSRKRVIILLSKKGLKPWTHPEPDGKRITMRDAIGGLPSLDPYVSDVDDAERDRMFPEYADKFAEGVLVSKWHYPPSHVKRQVVAISHTPTGKTAFDNAPEFRPRRADGAPARGYHTAYKRQEWDKPAMTVTMANGHLSSQNNGHPGRPAGTDAEGNPIWSDARALTVFELMRVTSLPDDWPIPKGYGESFIRGVIGEGVPPRMMERICAAIPEN